VLVLRLTDASVAIRDEDVVRIQFPLLEFAAAKNATVPPGPPAWIEVSGPHITDPADIPPAVLQRVEAIVGCKLVVETQATDATP
jgi:hypothetical protein